VTYFSHYPNQDLRLKGWYVPMLNPCTIQYTMAGTVVKALVRLTWRFAGRCYSLSL